MIQKTLKIKQSELNKRFGYLEGLKEGTKVTVLEAVNNGNDIWLRIPSGWVAGYYNGKMYVS